MATDQEAVSTSRVDTAAEYNKIAQAYAKATSVEKLWAHTTTYTFTNYVLNGSESLLQGVSVLDLGCGTGLFTRWAASQGASRVVGIDLSEQQILQARQLTDDDCNIEYRVQDITTVNAEEVGQFDVIFAAHVFCYSQSKEELRQMLDVASSCLKKGGRLIGIRECLDSASKGRVMDKTKGEIEGGPMFAYEILDGHEAKDFSRCSVSFRNEDQVTSTFTVFPVHESTMLQMFAEAGFKVNSAGPRLTCSPEGREIFPPHFIRGLTDEWGQLMWYFDATKL